MQSFAGAEPEVDPNSIAALEEWTMDNSTPVFWIWIFVVVLFAAAVTAALYVVMKAWGRFTKRND